MWRNRGRWSLLSITGIGIIRSWCGIPTTITTTISPNECGSESESESLSGAPPIRVLVTREAGRGVFASRRIKEGEVIHSAKPILSHPTTLTTTNYTNVCYLCLTQINNHSTSTFCTPLCQLQSKGFYEVEKQADWSSHTHHCCTQGLKYPFLAKRLACMVVSGEATAEALDILQPAILSSHMVSQVIYCMIMYLRHRFVVNIRHPENQVILNWRCKMEKEFTLLRKALEEANIPNEKISFLTKQWYIGVLARIRINAFRIEIVGTSYEVLLSLAAASVEAESAVGNALYMLPSFYNHDCDPNAHIVWIESADARMKALRDIDEGEELRICYIDASMDYDARQRILYEGFGFKCSCLRCQLGD